MRTHGFAASDVGRARDTNEDRFLCLEELGLYVVCDGMGGHAAGEVAAEAACAAAERSVRAARARCPELEDGTAAHDVLRKSASESLRAACEEVYRLATTDEDLAGMGCTMTLLLVVGERAVMAHVGDTRLYLFRDGSTWQLSSDHTLAADNMRQGLLTPEAMLDHPLSSALTRGLGLHPTVHPETLILDVFPDDVFVLCSDGLCHYLESPGELGMFLSSDDVAACPHALVELANERGGRDNITALVVTTEASDDEQKELYELALDVQGTLDVLRSSRLFEKSRYADLLRLFALAEVQAFRAGDVAIRNEDENRCLCIPVSGSFEIEQDGRTAALSPGTPAGMASLLLENRVVGTVRATADGQLLILGADAFHRLVRRRPWFGVGVLTQLASALGQELVRERTS